MEQDFWKNKLNSFLVKHPLFEGADPEVDIFTPRKDLKIRFWFEGGIQVDGEYETLEINNKKLGLVRLGFKSFLYDDKALKYINDLSMFLYEKGYLTNAPKVYRWQ